MIDDDNVDADISPDPSEKVVHVFFFIICVAKIVVLIICIAKTVLLIIFVAKIDDDIKESALTPLKRLPNGSQWMCCKNHLF